MIHYVEYNIETSRIIRRGKCQDGHVPAPRRSNGIALVRASYKYNAIICDKTDSKKRAVNPKPARKTFTDKPKKPITVIPEKKRLANVTNEQWDDVLKRLSKLEAKKPKD